jgi:predicted MFS family arabinose efflux permease
MGVISMAYFSAFVIAVPTAAFLASRQGWQVVFGVLAAGGALALGAALAVLPRQAGHRRTSFSPRQLGNHFHKPERLAGIIAAFLTSGGIVGFLTYAGAWLQADHEMSIERIGLLFMVSGVAAITASPLSGLLSDRTSKKSVIVWSNAVLAVLFVAVATIESGIWLVAGITVLSIAASARQAPLHAVTTEIVGADVRGEYIAVRNAASQLGIAGLAAVSSLAFDSGGFLSVSIVAASATILIPFVCYWIREPRH